MQLDTAWTTAAVIITVFGSPQFRPHCRSVGELPTATEDEQQELGVPGIPVITAEKPYIQEKPSDLRL